MLVHRLEQAYEQRTLLLSLLLISLLHAAARLREPITGWHVTALPGEA